VETPDRRAPSDLPKRETPAKLGPDRPDAGTAGAERIAGLLLI